MARERKTPIRAKDFRSWFKANLRDYARDIAGHGADAGYPWLTYTSDTVRLFDKFGDELWGWLAEDAEEFGHKNAAEFLGSFRRADMLGSLDQTKNLVVWYAAEKVAREIVGRDA